MTELDQLLHSDQDWIRVRAETALQIVNQRQTGQITSDEARELLEDLVRTDQLEAEADDMAMKTMLVNVVRGISLVV
jgi:polyhydroxyalkanoate synthesis regulator phasin